MKLLKYAGLIAMLMLSFAVVANAGADSDCCGTCCPAIIGSETAHSSMGGTTLNNTTAIFNAFPHLVVQNGNGIEFDTDNLSDTSQNGTGFGRVWWEAQDDLWVMMDVGRMDYGGRAANFMWSFDQMGGGFAPANFGNIPDFNYEGYRNPWLNMGIAKPTASGGAWSANLFFGSDSYKDNLNNHTQSSNGLGGLFSWGNGSDLNMSVELSTKNEKDQTATTEDKSKFTNASLNVRKDTSTRIFQGSLLYGSGNYEPDGGLKQDEKLFGLYGSCGRFLKNEDCGQTSVEFFASYGTYKYSYTDYEDKYTSVLIPGVRVSAWQMISKRFGVMGGVYGSYLISKEKETNPATITDATDRYHSYDWTAGLFYQPSCKVRVDMQFNKQNLGQIMSLGNNEPMAMYLGTTVGL